jgi:hypothetical protein
LASLITKEKLRKAMVELESCKAPRIDGVVSEFYKKFWDVVGCDYWLMMSIAIKQSKFLTRVTQGLITLLPKGGEKENFNN